MPLHLIVDIDNVTGQFQPWWATQWKQWFGQEIDPKELDRWDAYTKATGVESSFFWEWAKVADIWKRMPPVEGAQGALWTLKQRDHLIDFATSRPSDLGVTTRFWLNDHFGFLFTGSGYRSRLEFCAPDGKHNVRGDVYIDDSPETLRSLVAHGKVAVKFRCPWNKPVTTPHSVGSWREFEQLVDDLDEYEAPEPEGEVA